MERVLGLGGYFMRAADPAALSAWYRDCLGLDTDENGLWQQGAGPTVFAAFDSEPDYFGSRAQQTRSRTPATTSSAPNPRTSSTRPTGSLRCWTKTAPSSAAAPSAPTAESPAATTTTRAWIPAADF